MGQKGSMEIEAGAGIEPELGGGRSETLGWERLGFLVYWKRREGGCICMEKILAPEGSWGRRTKRAFGC